MIRKSKPVLVPILAQTVWIGWLFFAAARPLMGADQPAPTPVDDSITLETILKATLANNGQIHEAEGDIEAARAQLNQAKAALFPDASLLVIAAPVPGQHGDAVQSQTNWKQWGPYVQGALQVVEPIYSFGMIGNYRKAAENQIVARTGQAEMKRDEVLVSAKEMYYGYLMASDLERLVDDVSGTLKDAIDTAEKSSKSRRKSSVKPQDVYHLKAAAADLAQKKLMAEAAKNTAERAVAWVSGLHFTELPAPGLEAESFTEKPLDDYLKLARENRPELRALSAGEEARMALRDAKKEQSYPILFAGALGTAGWSPVYDNQKSNFAYNPYNSFLGDVGVGLKFDLDFAKHNAEAEEQEAELIKLKATESYAKPGIELQVKKAYWELEQASKGLSDAKDQKMYTRKWFVSNAMGWSIGITPAKDLMESLQGDALARKNYIETIYSLNMALAHLSQAVGVEVSDLKYR